MYTYQTYITSLNISDYIEDYRDADKFIIFCKQCDRYCNCWACPPYDFDTTDYISKYNKVYIIGTKIIISKKTLLNCNSAEESKIVGAEIIASVRKNLDTQLLKIESEILDSMAFFAGTCHICNKEDCTRIKNEPCLYPDKIRHSLESFGFDIGKTTEKLLDIELKWSDNGLLPEYLTLVSGLFTNRKIDNIEKYFIEI